MHKIYAKSALKLQDINTKINIGTDGIEVQLLNELLHKDRRVFANAYEDIFRIHEFDIYPIKVIHTPLVKGYFLDIEDLVEEPMCSLLEECFRFAQHFKASLIVHTSIYFPRFMQNSEFRRIFTNYIYRMLHKYPDVILLIENVMPYKKNLIHLTNGYLFDNLRLCEYLRGECKTKRVELVLDTCHMWVAENFLKMLGVEGDFSINRYLNETKDYLGLIHLADTKGMGVHKGEHGAPFDKDSKLKLYNTLHIIDGIVPNVPITLEVAETDYLVCDGYKKTYELVTEYYRR